MPSPGPRDRGFRAPAVSASPLASATPAGAAGTACAQRARGAGAGAIFQRAPRARRARAAGGCHSQRWAVVIRAATSGWMQAALPPDWPAGPGARQWRGAGGAAARRQRRCVVSVGVQSQGGSTQPMDTVCHALPRASCVASPSECPLTRWRRMRRNRSHP